MKWIRFRLPWTVVGMLVGLALAAATSGGASSIPSLSSAQTDGGRRELIPNVLPPGYLDLDPLARVRSSAVTRDRGARAYQTPVLSSVRAD